MSFTELDLSGRVALVTGAAQGLGAAEAQALAARGAAVLAADIADCDSTVRAIRRRGGTATATQIDLAAPSAGSRAVETALAEFGELDIVVNNAGIVRDRMSFNLSVADWDTVLRVNLTGTFAVCRAAAVHWRRRAHGAAPGRRVIVNTTSESGLYGNAGQTNYAAAKAGIVGMTLALAAELDRYNVRVNAIAPRARTVMSQHAFGTLPTVDGFDPFAPEHVAAVVAWLAGDAAHPLTGRVLVVHGGNVELLRGWTSSARVQRDAPWTDAELATLADRLQDDVGARHVPLPVQDLFTPCPVTSEEI